MDVKKFNLISGITAGVTGIAIAIVTYINPAQAEAINASIDVASVAFITICANFLAKSALKK